MGTRSDIIVHRADGKWACIYCHWDGYIEHNGKILFDHYTDQKKAEALAALGYLSSLGPEIGSKHPFDYPGKTFGKDNEYTPGYLRFKKLKEVQCTAYGRDRGDPEVEAVVGDTLQDVWPEADTLSEFTYVWHDDGNGPRWWVASPDEGSQTLVDLGQVLSGEIKLQGFKVKAFGLGVIGEHHATQPGKDHSWTWYRATPKEESA